MKTRMLNRPAGAAPRARRPSCTHRDRSDGRHSWRQSARRTGQCWSATRPPTWRSRVSGSCRATSPSTKTTLSPGRRTQPRSTPSRSSTVERSRRPSRSSPEIRPRSPPAGGDTMGAGYFNSGLLAMGGPSYALHFPRRYVHLLLPRPRHHDARRRARAGHGHGLPLLAGGLRRPGSVRGTCPQRPRARADGPRHGRQRQPPGVHRYRRPQGHDHEVLPPQGRHPQGGHGAVPQHHVDGRAAHGDLRKGGGSLHTGRQPQQLQGRQAGPGNLAPRKRSSRSPSTRSASSTTSAYCTAKWA